MVSRTPKKQPTKKPSNIKKPKVTKKIPTKKKSNTTEKKPTKKKPSTITKNPRVTSKKVTKIKILPKVQKTQKLPEPKLTPTIIRKMVLVELYTKKIKKGVYNPSCGFYTSDDKIRTNKELEAITNACLEYASKAGVKVEFSEKYPPTIKFN
jgi:hypothetical protein